MTFRQDPSDGILDWRLQDGMVRPSSTLLTLLGRGGQFPLKTADDWLALIHPDDQPCVKAALDEYLSQRCAVLETTHRLRCEDGSYRSFQVRGKAHWSSEGAPKRLFLFYRVMDGRPLTEISRDQQLELFQVILSVLPDFLIRMSGDGVYLDFLNGGDIELYSAIGRFVGESIYDVLPYDIAHQRMDYAKRALATGMMQTYDYIFPIEGKTVYEEARILKLKENEVLIIVRDITERKRAELMLRQSLEREQAQARIVDRMRQTLDIDQIFSATVQDVRQVLHCDRVVIYQFNPNWSGQFVAESVAEGWRSLLAQPAHPKTTCTVNHPTCCLEGPLLMDTFSDTYLKETRGGRYREGVLYHRVDNIAQAGFDDCYRDMLNHMQAQAYIITPIFQGDVLWGLLGAYQNTGPRPWDESEVRLLVNVGLQLAIAIQQASLVTQLQQRTEQQERTLQELKQTQLQLIQAEKMSSLGQLVAGVAHELNNPISFIAGNIDPIKTYVDHLLTVVSLYQTHVPKPPDAVQAAIQASELAFLKTDLPKALTSIEVGAARILETVTDLKRFSRLDQSGMKPTDLHDGIDTTLRILHNRLKACGQRPDIQVVRSFAPLPPVLCYPAQINQVFMNLLVNAIDAIDERLDQASEDDPTPSGRIEIITAYQRTSVSVTITDNGLGMTEDLQQRMCDPFFTTKPVNKGTGLGLAISYQIVVNHHGGELTCFSAPGRGTSFTLILPLDQGATLT